MFVFMYYKEVDFYVKIFYMVEGLVWKFFLKIFFLIWFDLRGDNIWLDRFSFVCLM